MGGGWALVPGPPGLTSVFPSVRVTHGRSIAPEVFERAFLDVPGARVVRPGAPEWWAWRGEYEDADDLFELGFTLFEVEPVEWGGSPLIAPSSAGSVLRLLRALESRLGAVYLHSDEALLYPSGAFERLFVR